MLSIKHEKGRLHLMQRTKLWTNGPAALVMLGVAGLSGAPVSAAADKADDAGFALEEITVTARKVQETLLNAPLAVTAVTGQALEERDMTDISSLADVAPNVNFSFGGTSSGSGSAAVVYIRGVGQNDFTPVTDPGVGIYIDGVYLGRTIGSVLDVMDFERIEVIRGPQGTLFGRNSIGGAINITTRDPGREFGGRLRVTGGQDRRVNIFGTVDVPLSETFQASFSGLYKSRRGYVDRVLVPGNKKLGDEGVLGGRAKFVWTPSDRLSFKLAVDGERVREQSAPEVATDVTESAPFIFLYNNNVFGNGAPAACAGTSGGPLTNPACANDQYAGAPFKSFETGPSQNDIDQWGVSLITEWQASENLAVKSITAYRDLSANFSRSSDATPFLIFQTTDDYGQNQFTQELQFLGTAFENRLTWVAGAFYMKEHARDIGLIEAVVPSFPRNIGGTTNNDNYAFFGEGTFDVTPAFHLTGGIRYTDETKRFDPVAEIIAVVEAGGDPYVPPGQRKLTFNEVTWRGTAAYDIFANASSYFTVSKGFKSGGFVIRLTQPAANPPTYNPETLIQYEAGLKMKFPDQGVRLNLAAFWSDYKGIQVAANPPGQINTVTANAAKGTIKGFEAELTWIPVPELFIQGALGYQDAKYDRIDPDINVAISLNDDLIRTPKWSLNLGVSYLINLGNYGTLTPRADWVYKSAIQFEPVNDARVAENGYNALNLSMAYEEPNSKWRATFGVNNVTDEKYIIAGDSNGTIGYALVVFARPRNWFLTVDYSF